MDRTLDDAVRGAVAGVVGGMAMTAMMKGVAPHVLPADMRPEKIAPKKFVEWAEAEAGHPEALTEGQEKAAAMAAHLGYSALMGALFGLARRRADAAPIPLAGAAFGLAVWAVSFEGWMPALGIMQRTTEKPLKQWPAPLMGHVVYGTATAAAYAALDDLL